VLYNPTTGQYTTQYLAYGQDVPAAWDQQGWMIMGSAWDSNEANTMVNNFKTGGASTEEDIMAALTNQIQGYLDQLGQRGLTINPNVEITPEKAAEFLAQAQGEIDPYYAGQLAIAREQFLRSIGYTTDQIADYETQMEKKYGQNLRTLSSNMAESGMVLSGARNLDEKNLAEDTQTSLRQAREEASFNTGTAARQFASEWGTSNMTTAPTWGATPGVTAGQEGFSRTSSTNPLYELSPEVYSGLVGSREWQQKQETQNRASELEGAWRTNEYYKQLRTLNL
jgi:hypothetical protein